MQKRSLKQLTFRYVLIMLSLIISFSLISFISIKKLLDENQQQKQLESLKIKAYNISVRLNFYREIMKGLSREEKTKEIIVFGTNNEAQLWAKNIQPLIPDSISVALFNEDGIILGRKEDFRVGELCYADLHNFLVGINFKKPAIHRNVPAYAHFDLLYNVISEGDIVGVLFASIKLSVLQNLLNELTEKNQHLRLISGDEALIVEANYHISKKTTNRKKYHVYKIPITNSDWYLEAHVEKPELTSVLIFITLINTLLFVLLSIILYIFSNRLISTFSSDFNTINEMLTDLKNHKMNTDSIHSKLNETENIINDIKEIAEDISESQQQLVTFSQCDDLTGLLNRRGFYNEAMRGIDLANRDIESTLVLLDLDYFKQINDNLGHKAGDEMLEILAACIKSSSRTVDIAGRLGGDEFSVVLVKCNFENALLWYAKLSTEFTKQQSKFDLSDNTKPCSLSAGCTKIKKDDADISFAISRADEALYAAKAAGRANIKGNLSD